MVATEEASTSVKKTGNLKSNEKKSKKRRNKSDHGPDFVPPDGGWAWVICIAAGLSNFSAFPVIQNFGLLFRERLLGIGLNSSEITTIINVNTALSAIVGLFNGPMFRLFSFRQVGIFASILMVIGLTLCTVVNTFFEFIFAFSILYGIGMGLNLSACSLVLNTYFKVKRRVATGISWSVTSLGPIVLPYLVNFLLDFYGVFGAVLTLTGLAMHALPAALIFQPVHWHTKKPDPNDKTVSATVDENENLCTYCRMRMRPRPSIFTSEYLYNSDEKGAAGYEILDPGTPMLARANDGWFSKENQGSIRSRRMSSVIPSSPSFVKNQSSSNLLKQRKEKTEDPKSDCVAKEGGDNEVQIKNGVGPESKPLSSTGATPITSPLYARRASNSFNREKEVRGELLSRLDLCPKSSDPTELKCTCQDVLEYMKSKEMLPVPEEEVEDDTSDKLSENFSFFEKVMIFFEFDLLKDFTYDVLMLGLTVAQFTEVNFATLTPFILSDFGYNYSQIALFMSILGALDSVVRFVIPFIAEKIGWENKTFFLIGITGMAIGRIVIAHIRNYNALLFAAAWIGMNKALRTVFMCLVLPTYVPLERLPGASGLQLLSSGIFFFTFGPVIGAIRDATDYVITLHCLNVGTFLVVICWILEDLRVARKRKRSFAPKI